MIKEGRICLKTTGREGGNYCVITKKIDDSFVEITGPKSITGIKRRNCNLNHIEPISEMLDIGSGSDKEVEEAWRSSGLIDKLGIKVPTRHKEAKQKTAKPVKKRKAASKKK